MGSMTAMRHTITGEFTIIFTRTGVKFAQKLNWSVKTRECYGMNKKRLSEGGIEPVTVWIKDGNFNPKTGRDIILKNHPATLHLN